MKKIPWIVLAALALALQLAGLCGLMLRWARVEKEGVEVRIPCGAFDPNDPLRGRYLHVGASRECADIRLGIPREEQTLWYLNSRFRRGLWAKLESDGNGIHQVATVAERPLDDGLWVRPSECWFHAPWNEDAPKDGALSVNVRFPGKLFMDERFAKNADKLFAGRSASAEAVAVYRALGDAMILVDVELDGRSIRELARRTDQEK